MLARHSLLALVCLALVSPVLAQEQGQAVRLQDSRGYPFGTIGNPINVTGGGGGGSTANPYPGSDYAKNGTLPTNAAQADKQDTGNTSLSSVATSNGAIATATGSQADAATASGANSTIIGALRAIRDKLLGSIAVTGTFWQATQPVSLASAPLPTNAATADRQDTGNASEATVATNTTALSTATGTQADAATASGANTSIVGALRAIRDRLLGTLNTNTTLTISNNSIGALGVTSSTYGLTTVSRVVSAAATTNATSVKAGVGRVYKITGYNTAASARWLRFYNVTTTPVPGTTTAFFALPLPPGAFSFDAQDIGYSFSAGIGYALTTGAADADATALTAGDIVNLNVWYQ